jgi:putative hemolysin
MKHLLFLPIISFNLLLYLPTFPPMPNPASAYVAFLGYKEVVRKDAKGEYGVCIFPDGSECEEWQFYRGICGKEHSYCSRKGCETYSINVDKGSYKAIYCACGCLDSLGNKKVTPLEEFMEQHGDTLIKTKPGRKGYAY